MPTLKLHYDGWLSLPARLRQALGLNSGDRLEAELVDGALVLRPVAKTQRPAPAGEAAVPVDADAAGTLPLAADGAPVRRKPGRPRKVTPVADEQVTAPKKARGRPRKATPAGDSDAAASTRPVLGPPKLLKKTDLEGRAAPPDVAVLFRRQYRSGRTGHPSPSSAARFATSRSGRSDPDAGITSGIRGERAVRDQRDMRGLKV